MLVRLCNCMAFTVDPLPLQRGNFNRNSLKVKYNIYIVISGNIYKNKFELITYLVYRGFKYERNKARRIEGI